MEFTISKVTLTTGQYNSTGTHSKKNHYMLIIMVNFRTSNSRKTSTFKKVRSTSVSKNDSICTRNGWPTAWTRTSFSAFPQCILGTTLTVQISCLDSLPPADFLSASTIWPNAPLPRRLINLYSSWHFLSLSSCWWPVTQQSA